MISKQRLQAKLLDRLLLQMLEGNDTSGDHGSEAGAAVAEIRPLLDAAQHVRGLLSTQGPSPEFISKSQNRLLQRGLEVDIAAGDPAFKAGAAAEIRPLLETADRVRRFIPTQAPAPEFVTASENRLLWRIKPRTSTSARRSSAGFFQRGWLRTAAAMAAAVVVVSVSGWGVASASAGTLPGDRLYPVKRGLEEVSLAVSMSAAGDLNLLTDFADVRVSEIEQLAVGERGDDLLAGLENYDETLTRLDAAVDQLSPDFAAARLEDIQARLARHAEALLALRDRLPEQTQAALTRAVEHSQKSRDRVAEIKNKLDLENADPAQGLISTKESIPGIDNPASTNTSSDANPGATAQPLSGTPDVTESQEFSQTPKPSDTPTPKETDKPTNTSKPSKTDKPSNTPKPENTDKPTKIPDPSNTPKPENTDKPTKIPDPSNTPKPENTDKPTKIPDPSNTPKPENTDKPDNPKNNK